MSEVMREYLRSLGFSPVEIDNNVQWAEELKSIADPMFGSFKESTSRNLGSCLCYSDNCYE